MGFEFNKPIDGGKERIISATANVCPRVNLRAALPDYDGTGMHCLTPEPFDSEPFGLAITTAMCAAAAFFMSH
jgi:hypothetical protein